MLTPIDTGTTLIMLSINTDSIICFQYHYWHASQSGSSIEHTLGAVSTSLFCVV